MVLVSVVADSGAEAAVEVARDDLVAEVKARIVQRCFPAYAGQLLTLAYHGKEMADEKSIGDYGVRNLNGSRFVVGPAMRQPYSKVDYARISRALVADGFKRPAAAFYAPGEWAGQWAKGDEYKQYPPVVVDNPFSTVAPSASRELTPAHARGRTKHGREPPRRAPPALGRPAQAYSNGTASAPVDAAAAASANKPGLYCEIPERIRQKRAERERRRSGAESAMRESKQEERERQFRRARQKHHGGDFEEASTGTTSTGAEEDFVGHPGRSYSSLYVCNVRGCSFRILHCTEGKWQGEGTFLDASFHQPVSGAHVSSSKVCFHASQGSWSEQQLITGSNGVSTKHHFSYHPQADGVLYIEAHEGFLRGAVTKMQEVSPFVILITSVSQTGEPVLTESITYNAEFNSRVRAGQRFNEDGSLIASYVCHERKYVDEDSGALEPVFPRTM